MKHVQSNNFVLSQKTIRSDMGRTYAEWEATQDKALVAKVRADRKSTRLNSSHT